MVAFSDNAVNTLVVPLIKLPETVKLTAVPAPMFAGLANCAFKFSWFVVADETGFPASFVLSTLLNPTLDC